MVIIDKNYFINELKYFLFYPNCSFRKCVYIENNFRY